MRGADSGLWTHRVSRSERLTLGSGLLPSRWASCPSGGLDPKATVGGESELTAAPQRLPRALTWDSALPTPTCAPVRRFPQSPHT